MKEELFSTKDASKRASRIGSLLGIIPCTVPDCVMVKMAHFVHGTTE